MNGFDIELIIKYCGYFSLQYRRSVYLYLQECFRKRDGTHPMIQRLNLKQSSPIWMAPNNNCPKLSPPQRHLLTTFFCFVKYNHLYIIRRQMICNKHFPAHPVLQLSIHSRQYIQCATYCGILPDFQRFCQPHKVRYILCATLF